MNFAVGGILMLLVVGLVLALGVVLLVWGIVLMRGTKAGADSGVCGRCGYMVKGLSALECPECGADLREVGIVPARSASNRGVGIAMVVVGVLFLLSICVCSGMFFVYSTGAPARVMQPAPVNQPAMPQPPSTPPPSP